MSAVLEPPPVGSSKPPAGVDERVVRVYRLDWSFLNLELDQLPPGRTVEDDETAYYAARHVDQVWPHVQAWLAEVPGSDVIVAIEEWPLEEWIASCDGDPEDAEP